MAAPITKQQRKRCPEVRGPPCQLKELVQALLHAFPPGHQFTLSVSSKCISMYPGIYFSCKRGNKCPEYEKNTYYIMEDFLTWPKKITSDRQRFSTCAEIEHIIRTELLQCPGHTKYTINVIAVPNTVSAYAKPHGTAVYKITAQSISADGRSIEYSGEAVIDT